MKSREILSAYCAENELSDENAEALISYMYAVLEENRVQNLTAITDEADFVVSHLIDSLSVVKYIPENACVIDVGTGAGFPGMVLRLVRPDIRLTLLDSLAKRLSFIERTAQSFGIDDITYVHSRAEDGAREKTHRERYDVAVARAVANLSALLEYCAGFVKPGGIFIAMKGRDAEAELSSAGNAAAVLGLSLKAKDAFALPLSGAERTLLIYEKTASTNAVYPRAPKRIRDKPLK